MRVKTKAEGYHPSRTVSPYIRRCMKMCRYKLGMTQEELARRTGLSASFVVELEDGKVHLPMELWEAFEDVLQLEKEELWLLYKNSFSDKFK